LNHRTLLVIAWIPILCLLFLYSPAVPEAQAQWEGIDDDDWGEKPAPPPKEKPDAPPGEETPAPSPEEDERPRRKGKVELVFNSYEGFGLKYEQMKLAVHALVQTDLRFFETYDNASNGFFVRRAYAGFDGTLESWLSWKAEYDFATSSARDCYARADLGDIPVYITGGYFKPALSWEWFRQLPQFLNFMERASHVATLVPGRTVGLMGEFRVPGEKGAPPLVRGWLGLHNGNAGTFGNVNNDWGLSMMVEATPVADRYEKLLVQAGFSNWFAYNTGTTTSWTGFSPDFAVRFFGPYGRRGLEQVHAVHGAVFYQQFAAMFEYSYGMQQRKRDGPGDLSPIVATGFHLDLCALVYDPQNPGGDLFRNTGFNEGVEVCLRIERFTLNDAHRGTASRVPASTAFNAPNAMGGRMTAVTLGGNWYVTSRVRVTFNMQSQWFDLEGQNELFPATDPDRPRTGGPRFVWELRFQIFI